MTLYFLIADDVDYMDREYPKVVSHEAERALARWAGIELDDGWFETLPDHSAPDLPMTITNKRRKAPDVMICKFDLVLVRSAFLGTAGGRALANSLCAPVLNFTFQIRWPDRQEQVAYIGALPRLRTGRWLEGAEEWIDWETSLFQRVKSHFHETDPIKVVEDRLRFADEKTARQAEQARPGVKAGTVPLVPKTLVLRSAAAPGLFHFNGYTYLREDLWTCRRNAPPRGIEKAAATAFEVIGTAGSRVGSRP